MLTDSIHSKLLKMLVLFLVLFTFISTAKVNDAFAKSLRGTVKIDGSSTVFPITEAVAEEFGRKPGCA